MKKLFSGIYQGKTVLITGHTGFKGSWLAYWLDLMGARVIGYSVSAPTNPSHFNLLNMDIDSIEGDIRNSEYLNDVFAQYKPDIVFHLAAQSLVRFSYDRPIETYETNVMGTLKVFEACRSHGTKAIVNVTSDKSYENKEWLWGYRENDPMGGFDPYSSSKGCAELLTSSYRNSYFNLSDYKNENSHKMHHTLLASCRAGNVIGGGDWAKDRLMTDIMMAASNSKEVKIRNPDATRPWQHVLEPLSGYLQVGQKLLEGEKLFSDAWNFGPTDEGNISVIKVLESVKSYWSKINYKVSSDVEKLHEANLLKLDCSKANFLLNWKTIWDSSVAFEKTVLWYKDFYENYEIRTQSDLLSYISCAQDMGIQWCD